MNSNFKDEVKARTDIIELIGEDTYIDVSSDDKWKPGICPFCQGGKIFVEPNEQVFKSPCCDLKGDVFVYIQEKHETDFKNAVAYLARRLEIEIPKRFQQKETNGHTKMESKPRRKIFGFFKRSVPYFKDLRKLTGSVTASILMSQLEYWFEDKNEFYKFLEPAEGNPQYKPGDSWCESLAFSKDEFRAAFDRIGIRYPSKTKFLITDPKEIFINEDGDEKFYCSYFDKVRGLTYYFRNPKTDELLDDLLKNMGDSKTQSPEIRQKKRKKRKSGKLEIPISGN